MTIRKAELNDLNIILKIFEHARNYMKENNNPNQWGDNHPPASLIEEDIKNSIGYVCLDDENNIVGYFCFYVGIEEDYNQIYEGNWLNDKEYAVIHRIATMSNKKGVGGFCMRYCFDKYKNIKIDTSEYNIPMQKLLEREGYTKCGIIKLRRNEEDRIAFQKSE
ncbi:GNAT family N-acetyltransferase [Brachyspira catarrhinii]|uniref:GNAT family N-acetyltransferase n=1 Tax=Brachyspira catarrhinii TaxID=2528966 RepID=A0ABY2TRI3_9SPIR|nr:GNAT family N-acetyltransferase [Brachyspira catarrhinii]TKZ35462.1 GNAT family N-acetyltransferase [Brachyspira catarrhinii]